MKKHWLVLLTILAVLVAACGGGDDSDASDNAAETDESSQDGSADDSESDSSDDTSADDSSDGDSSNDSSDGSLSDLLGRQSDSRIKITYLVDGDEMTIAYDGSTDPPRASILQGDSLMISPGDGDSVECSVDVDPPTCTQMFLPGDLVTFMAAAMFGGFGFLLGAEQGIGDLPFIDSDTSSEEIIGRSASCVTWSLSELGGLVGDADASDVGSVTTCVDDESGWPLRLETVSGDGSSAVSVEATAISEPTDADFEPPAEVEQLDDQLGDLGDLEDILGNIENGDLGDLEDILGDITVPETSG